MGATIYVLVRIKRVTMQLSRIREKKGGYTSQKLKRKVNIRIQLTVHCNTSAMDMQCM